MAKDAKRFFKWGLEITIIVSLVICVLSMQNSESTLKVSKPLWELDGLPLDRNELNYYIDEGRISLLDDSPVTTDKSADDFIQTGKGGNKIITMLKLDGQDYIKPYNEYFTVKAGGVIYFTRVIESKAKYSLIVQRSLVQVTRGPKGEIIELKFPETLESQISGNSVNYTVDVGREINTYKYSVDPCLPPGEYLYRPKGLVQINLLKRRDPVNFPTVLFKVQPDEKPKPICYGFRPYMAYFDQSN